MEKYGVEIVDDEASKKQKFEKLAKDKKPVCKHPKDRVYSSDGVEYCRACGKYLKIGN